MTEPDRPGGESRLISFATDQLQPTGQETTVKIITVIAERVSPDSLNAALQADGIIAVTVTEARAFSRATVSAGCYCGVKVAEHFTPNFRIELEVEDAAAGAAIEGIAFARSAGLFGKASVRLSDGSAVDNFITAHSQAA